MRTPPVCLPAIPAQILVSANCPIGKELLDDLAADGRWSVGAGPQFHFWPVYGDAFADCPTIVYYRDGVEQSRMIGYQAGLLPIVLAKHPLCDPRVESWRTRPRTPPGLSPPGCWFQMRTVAPNWGPGLAVRYKSNTDIGIGTGFGSGWSRPTGAP